MHAKSLEDLSHPYAVLTQFMKTNALRYPGSGMHRGAPDKYLYRVNENVNMEI